jgi:uncharacterized protein (TIGR00251 family)
MRLKIRLSPKSSANRIDAISLEPDQTWVVRVKVTAPPDKGKANEALISLLARDFHVRPSGLTLIMGLTDRNKVIEIAPDLVDQVTARLQARR